MYGISATRLSRRDPWAFRPILADGLVLSLPAVNGVSYETKKSRAAENLESCDSDISATRLSRGRPVGFPSHPRGWFSIVVYPLLSCNWTNSTA